MTSTHLDLPLLTQLKTEPYPARLTNLLTHHDLGFHQQDSSYASHNFHAFPAKFPPQLPALFIQALTDPGDLVLDPMQGSGTTTLEASLFHRCILTLVSDYLS
ncbi:MAG: hypothetical protein JXA78_09820 [Anaerolineales bacterium]|nr:hypothetical protein [Anaerolineales bacterium]